MNYNCCRSETRDAISRRHTSTRAGSGEMWLGRGRGEGREGENGSQMPLPQETVSAVVSSGVVNIAAVICDD
jgi:hypothetical protein